MGFPLARALLMAGSSSNHVDNTAVVAQKLLFLFYQRFDASNIVKRFRRPEGKADKSTAFNENVEEALTLLDHLLSLITVCYQLSRDCGENQRLLVQTMPQLFSTLLVDCLKVSPAYARFPASNTVTPE